ncbi:hypothetical protein Bbelb_260850 [Branchiostoma belcheri]|nr:hypothetical protein Bbelb_260850 [Branchiostoma belcheri]
MPGCFGAHSYTGQLIVASCAGLRAVPKLPPARRPAQANMPPKAKDVLQIERPCTNPPQLDREFDFVSLLQTSNFRPVLRNNIERPVFSSRTVGEQTLETLVD